MSCTNSVTEPNNITGFLPYRSAIIPQSTEVKALPNIKADPSIMGGIISTKGLTQYS